MEVEIDILYTDFYRQITRRLYLYPYNKAYESFLKNITIRITIVHHSRM